MSNTPQLRNVLPRNVTPGECDITHSRCWPGAVIRTSWISVFSMTTPFGEGSEPCRKAPFWPPTLPIRPFLNVMFVLSSHVSNAAHEEPPHDGAPPPASMSSPSKVMFDDFACNRENFAQLRVAALTVTCFDPAGVSHSP
jgi:hypothetical protein